MSPTPTAKIAPRTAGRGQALVMMALGMLLLTVMVLMTVSFGSRAKQKMEVQLVADQAAYSTAVAVARGFNMTSMTNRVMIAHMVALLGIQSAISFAGAYMVLLWQFLIWYSMEIANQLRCCKKSCFYYGCFTAFIVFITRWLPAVIEFFTKIGMWFGLDAAAAAQARRTGWANIYLYGGELELVSNWMYRSVNNQGTARRVVQAAAGGAAGWTSPNGSDRVALEEVGFMGGSPVAMAVGAINQTNLILTDRHAVAAAMGSRGHFFTANRSSFFFLNGVRQMLSAAFRRIGSVGRDINMNQFWWGGSGYFSAYAHGSNLFSASSRFAFADDHAIGIGRYTGPAARRPIRFPLLPVSVLISSTGIGVHAAFWMFVLQVVFPMVQPPILYIMLFFPPSDAMHTVPALCMLNCPGVWSNFVDYNVWRVMDRGDNYAQPKLPVIVYKDQAAMPRDPFDLRFNFGFRAGARYDTKGTQVRSGSGTVDISRQAAFSTGQAYFHRKDHWREPPNLFNAYWRAGLTRGDVDDDGPDDIADTMRNGGVGWGADAYDALRSASPRYWGIQ